MYIRLAWAEDATYCHFSCCGVNRAMLSAADAGGDALAGRKDGTAPARSEQGVRSSGLSGSR